MFIDKNNPVVQACIKEIGGKPVRAVVDGCSQGGADSYVLKADGNPLCGEMWFGEAKALADMLNLVLAEAAKPTFREKMFGEFVGLETHQAPKTGSKKPSNKKIQNTPPIHGEIFGEQYRET